jgi:hypothetical protein
MHKLAMILCVISVSLTAQWPNHPTPGMPRTPEGKPDLLAPAPRLTDGKRTCPESGQSGMEMLYSTSQGTSSPRRYGRGPRPSTNSARMIFAGTQMESLVSRRARRPALGLAAPR